MPKLQWEVISPTMSALKHDEKVFDTQEKSTDLSTDGYEINRNETNQIGDVADVGQLQRHLGNRQVQLIAIGGSIGTATFISIANGLVKGGPDSLLIAYTLYSCILGLVNNSMAEMASFSMMPVPNVSSAGTDFMTSAGVWGLHPHGWSLGRRVVGLLGWVELLPLRSLSHTL